MRYPSGKVYMYSPNIWEYMYIPRISPRRYFRWDIAISHFRWDITGYHLAAQAPCVDLDGRPRGLHNGDVFVPVHDKVRFCHLVARGEVQPDLEEFERIRAVRVNEGEHLAVNDALASWGEGRTGSAIVAAKDKGSFGFWQ